jgi:hypothetical protein
MGRRARAQIGKGQTMLVTRTSPRQAVAREAVAREAVARQTVAEQRIQR